MESRKTKFSELALSVITRDIPQNIDHMVISDGYLKGKKVTFSPWNHDKKLSDHIGVAIDCSCHQHQNGEIRYEEYFRKGKIKGQISLLQR